MTTSTKSGAADFIEALVATGPAPEHAEALMLYGQLVGNWDTEAKAYLPDGAIRKHYWQVHFSWALEGRAIQDVWITPARSGPHVGKSEPWGRFSNQYGTSLRRYDPKTGTWAVTWIDPANQYTANLTGRLQDGEIFQEGVDSDGTRLRWIFSHIQRDSFRWRAELSTDGATWHKVIEMSARRTS